VGEGEEREGWSAARRLASPAHWQSLGWFEGDSALGLILWGEVQGREADPYRTSVRVGTELQRCGCRSRQRPCKHARALALLWKEGRSHFPTQPVTMPDWVAAGVERRTGRSGGALPVPSLPGMEVGGPMPAAGKRADRRDGATAMRGGRAWEARVQAGLRVLEDWLEDLVRGGVAAFGSDWESECERMAGRMVACQATGVAGLLRQLGALSSDLPDYPDRLTSMIGHLSLLTLAWRRSDRLRPEERVDLWTATGWPQRRQEALGSAPLIDRWLHLGTSLTMEGRLHRRLTWIRGDQCGRLAVLISHSPTPFPAPTTALGAAEAPEMVEEAVRPGQTFAGTVHLFPGADPLRGLVTVWRSEGTAPPDLPGATPVNKSLWDVAASLAINPWRETFPMVLRQVVPGRRGPRWWLRDGEGGELPLPANPLTGWRLLALGAGNPLDLFGEWDGRQFSPLTAVVDRRWIAL
jgi:hypothetical protein